MKHAQANRPGPIMARKTAWIAFILLALSAIYLVAWPVPVAPIAWDAPPNPGYTGPYAVNDRLTGAERFAIDGHHGPEDIALDSVGRIYLTTHEGAIVRLNADGSAAKAWVQTGGRPLGIDFDGGGNLIVADAYLGLLSVAPTGEIRELATRADGIAIRYANNVDVAADGRIYFSDASMKFGARENAGTYAASLLDLIEHGGHGRLLVYDPARGEATTLLGGLNFANGVAVSPDQSFVLVNETGGYRVVRYWLAGPRMGQSEHLIEHLPGFPDNLNTGLDGRFWLGLASPRNALLDKLAGKPFLRKMVQRAPKFLRPKAVHYGHVLAIDADGDVVADLQDPTGNYPITTSVTETREYLYIGSLVAPELARIANDFTR